MTFINSFRCETQPASFDAFLKLLQEQIQPSSVDSLEDGVREIETASGPASLALDRARLFVAARWTVRIREIGRCYEAYFVVPASKPAQTGIRMWSLGESSDDDGDAPPWWRSFCGAHPIQRSGTPSFTELACLLSSEGGILTQSEGLAERVGALNSEVAYLQTLLIEHQDELRRTKAALRQARELGLTAALGPTPSGSTAPESTAADLADLPAWCADHEDEIVVLPRALNGAKKSQYEDPALIFTALEMLAGPYRRHRTGQLSKAEFDEILLPTGLRYAASVAPSTAGEQGEAYFVQWGGRRRFLDSHLLKGGGREDRYCLRVYFFWDADSSRVVCGSLPAHLQNSLT